MNADLRSQEMGTMLSDEGRRNLYARLEQLGEDRVRADMESGGLRVVGGPAAIQDAAWDWLNLKKREREQAATTPSYSVTIHGPQAQVMLGSSHSSQTMTINWQGDIEQQIGSFVDTATQTLAEIRHATDAQYHDDVDGIAADLADIKRQLAKPKKKNAIIIVELLRGVVTDMTAIGAVHAIGRLVAPLLEQGHALLKLLGIS